MKVQVLIAALVCFAASSCSEDGAPGGDSQIVTDAGHDGDGDDGTASHNDGSNDGSADATVDPCASLSDKLSDYENYQLLLACLRDDAADPGDKDKAVAAFVEIVEAAGGFPIVDNKRVVFVYVRRAELDVEDDKQTAEDFSLSKRKEPIRVAGSFNQWNPAQHPLKREGADLFHAEIPLDASGKERFSYKLIAKDEASADVWFSDPLSRRFGYDENGRYSIIKGGDDNGKAVGHLEWIRSVHATQLNNNRRIYIYVPRGYDHSPAKRYPVLYMHDGNNLFDPLQPASAPDSWDVDGVVEQEISGGQIQELIIVGIPNNPDRFDEYTHVQDQVTVNGQPQTVGGKGKAYLDFVVNDLKPVVDSRYRTKPGKEDTAIMGSSLGGLISYYAGLEHPGLFRYIGGMSTTFGWGQINSTNPTMEQLYKQQTSLSSAQQVYYLDSGDNPQNPTNPPTCPASGEDNYCETIQFREMLVSKGIDTFPTDPDSFPLTPAEINIYHYHEPDAPHNESAWHARLFRPLRLFFRP